MNTIIGFRKMATKARIFAGLFLVCIIVPSLADVSIHVNNVAHVKKEDTKFVTRLPVGRTPKPVNPTPNLVPVNLMPVLPTPNPVPGNPTPNSVPVNPMPVNPVPGNSVPVNPVPGNPVPVNPVPGNPVLGNPTLNPVPVNPVSGNPMPVNPVPGNPVPVNPVLDNPTPNPVLVNPVPGNPVPVNPVPGNPLPVNPVPSNLVPVNPVPVNPVPVDPTPNPVLVNNVPAGYPGGTQAPMTMQYGGGPITPNPSNQNELEQPAADKYHPTPKEIKEHRKREGLQEGFYADTCPNAEKIIKDGMIRAFGNDSSMAAPIPRLLLHDCFVNGCDASLFLDQTPSGARVEKLATSNGPTVRGFDLIDEIKAKLEAECPGIVSCSDLLAYLARDAFVVSGVPHYDVPGGRRDGMESLEANVLGNLPLPDFTVDKMIDLFNKKGLNVEDLVVLIGAHSIGVAHCFSFRYRVDDPQKATMVDPRLAGVMKFACTSPTSTLAFDTTTQYKMDSIYYKQLVGKRGLLESDVLLSEDPRTKDLITRFGDDENGWFNKLGNAMNKLASIQVLTGDQGQIRKQCRSVN